MQFNLNHRCRSVSAAVAGLLLASALLPQVAWAQLPVTQLSTLFPNGAKQGQLLDIALTGVDLDDAIKLTFSHPGIVATPKMTTPNDFEKVAKPVPNLFSVQVAADVPVGTYEVRATGRFGESNPRLFVVSNMVEMTDATGNGTADKSIEVPAGSVLSGQIDGNGLDFVKLPLKAGQRVLINCIARRLDSRLDGVLQLLDPTGKEIARAKNVVNGDPVIDFNPPADGYYGLKIFDSVYGKGNEFFYRLEITSTPVIEFVFPPSAAPGAASNVTLYGLNLPGGVPADGLTRNGFPLQKLAVTINLPGDDVSKAQLAITPQLPPRTAFLDGIAYQLPSPAGMSNTVPIFYARAPIVPEVEPNSLSTQPQKITLPAEVVGQFMPRGDLDWFQFDAKKGDALWVDVISHRLGLDTDPYFALFLVNKNDKGEEVLADVAQVDDAPERPQRIGSDLDASTDDPTYQLNVPADGTYRLMLRDQAGAGGSDPASTYRLVIRPATPDFRLLAQGGISLNTAQAQLTPLTSNVVRKGGSMVVTVQIDRQDGFNGDITITAEGLPGGMTCQGAVASGDYEKASLVLNAAEGMGAFSGPIKIVGRAQIAGKDVAREARAGQVYWGTANRQQDSADFRLVPTFNICVLDKEVEPALVQLGEDKVWETSLGGKLEIPVNVTRRGEGKEAIKLLAANLPDQIKPAEVNLDGNTAVGKLDIIINQQNTKPGTYTFHLKGDTKVKHVRNPEAIPAAEAEQKLVDEAVKLAVETAQKSNAAKDEATKLAQDGVTLATQAEQNRNNMATVAKQKAEAAKVAVDNLAKAKDAAAKDPTNAGLQDAAKNAQTAADQAAAEQKTADDQLAVGEKALVDAQANRKAKDEAKVVAETANTAAQQKMTQGNQIKQQVDQRVAQVKQLNQPKDLTFALISLPIKLKVVATPIIMTAPPPAAALKQGEKTQLTVNLQRLYNFAENVELTVQLPPGLQGLQVANLNVPGPQAEGKMDVTAAANATPGDHILTIKAKGRFNNVEVVAQTTVPLKIEAVVPTK